MSVSNEVLASPLTVESAIAARQIPASPAGLLHHLQVFYQNPSQLQPASRNARTHTPRQVGQIAGSIQRFGFVNPILVNGKNQVVAGHGRLAAAIRLRLAEIPTLCLDHLTPAEQRAYALADNRLAELAGWDREILGLELQELVLDLDEIEVVGFSSGEVDVLLGELATSDAALDDIPLVAAGPAITGLGDLWEIGPHRLLCGDALQPESYTRLLGGRRAQLVFTDPPFNVPVQGHVSGLGKTQHREFAMASGEMSIEEFTAFLRTTFTHLVNHCQSGAINFVCMDWRHVGEVLAAASGIYSELKNVCVWMKTNAGMGSLYRSQHELVFVYKAGNGPHVNNVELGRHGRYRTNIWQYAGANTFHAERDRELTMHPTVKPVAMVADAIRDCSKRKGLVLDPFGGSGSTLMAAEQTGRHGYLMEIDPQFCDVIITRLREMTDLEPRLAGSGHSFDEVKAQRLVSESEA